MEHNLPRQLDVRRERGQVSRGFTSLFARVGIGGVCPKTGLDGADLGLVFASFYVVIDDQREDHKNPHREDAHSGDSFRNQARQERPSTA